MGGFSTVGAAKPTSLPPLAQAVILKNMNFAVPPLPPGVERWLYIGRISIVTTGIVSSFKIDTPVFANGYTICNVNVYSDVGACIRVVDANNFYHDSLAPFRTADDHVLGKIVNGVTTIIAAEAIDIGGGDYAAMTRAVGTTIESRWGTSPWFDDLGHVITATDTSLSSGVGGGFNYKGNYHRYCIVVRERSKPVPVSPPLYYFDVPVAGSGSPDDPFRALMPEEIATDPTYGRTNRLSITHSSLIPTSTSGKPIHGNTIVRVFDQPGRQAHLRPLTDAVNALQAMRGVRKLLRDGAIALALKMDDKLHILDLLPAREAPQFRALTSDKRRKKAAKEYYDWRVYTVGVKEELLSLEGMEEYVESEKGW